MPDFIPRSDDNLIPFYQAQTDEIPGVVVTLGLNAPKAATCVSLCATAQQAILDVATKEAELAAAVAAKNTAVPAANHAVRELRADGQRSANYTPAIGATLLWIPPGNPFDPNTYKGDIYRINNTAPAEVTLFFRKASGNIDGVNVYVRRQGETVWRLLTLRLDSPYIDHTPLFVAGVPEVREYRIRGVINDVEIGLFSDPAIVTVA